MGQGISGLRGGVPGLLRRKPVRTAVHTAALGQRAAAALLPVSGTHQPASTALTSEPDAMTWQLGSRMAEEW